MPTDRVLVALLLSLLAAALLSSRRRLAPVLLLAGVALVLAGMVAVRWLESGHPPVFGTYEMDLVETLLIVALGIALRREAGPVHLGATAVAAALTLGHTFALRSEATPLTISEQSLWIDLHAALAWVTWALYTHALLLAFRGEDMQQRATFLLARGFVAQTASGFVGVYYATLLFATPWSWDPVQTLGLLSWVLAAVALHFRLFFGVSPARQRYFLVLVMACYVACSKLLPLLPPGQSFHVFELGALAGPPR